MSRRLGQIWIKIFLAGLGLMFSAPRASADTSKKSFSKLGPQQMELLWTDLGNRDGAVAYRAIHTFLRSPEEATAFLERKVQPVQPVERRRMEQLIKDLGSDHFQVRTRAAQELDQLGEHTLADLPKALAATRSLEVRRRIEKLLKKVLASPDPVALPGDLQKLRAVEILEHLHTPAARLLLEKLSQGIAGARLTLDAQEALQRLGKNGSEAQKHSARPVAEQPRQLGGDRQAGPLGYLAFFSDGKTLVAAGEDIRLIDLETGKLQRLIRLPRNALAIMLCPEEKLVVVSGNHKAPPALTRQTWGLAKTSQPQSLSWKIKEPFPMNVAISPDGKLLAGNDYKGLTVWDLVRGKEVWRLKEFWGPKNLAFSPDGSLIGRGGSYYGEIIDLVKWEKANVKQVADLEEGYPFPATGFGSVLVFAPNGKWAVARRGAHFQVLQLPSHYRRLPLPSRQPFAWSLPAVSPDGRSIAIATGEYENQIEVLERSSGTRRFTLKGFDPRVRCLAFSTDNRWLAAGLNDASILIWDLLALPVTEKKKP